MATPSSAAVRASPVSLGRPGLANSLLRGADTATRNVNNRVRLAVQQSITGLDSGLGGYQARENAFAYAEQLTEVLVQLEDLGVEVLQLQHDHNKFKLEAISADTGRMEEIDEVRKGSEEEIRRLQEENRQLREIMERMEGRMENMEGGMESMGVAIRQLQGDMQRMSSVSARAAEERPVHMPGDEEPSTSGRDMHAHIAQHTLPEALFKHMSWERQRNTCTLKLDNIVHFQKEQNSTQELITRAQSAIRALGGRGPQCSVTQARWATPMQQGMAPNRLLITLASPQEAAQVLSVGPQWLGPRQRILEELGEVELAVAKVVRQEFARWQQGAPPGQWGAYRMVRACVVDAGGNMQLFSQAAIDAGMAAMQRQSDRRVRGAQGARA